MLALLRLLVQANRLIALGKLMGRADAKLLLQLQERAVSPILGENPRAAAVKEAVGVVAAEVAEVAVVVVAVAAVAAVVVLWEAVTAVEMAVEEGNENEDQDVRGNVIVRAEVRVAKLLASSISSKTPKLTLASRRCARYASQFRSLLLLQIFCAKPRSSWGKGGETSRILNFVVPVFSTLLDSDQQCWSVDLCTPNFDL